MPTQQGTKPTSPGRTERQDEEQAQGRGAGGKRQAGQWQPKRAHLPTDSEQHKKAFELPAISLSSSLCMVTLDIIQGFSKARSMVSLLFLPLSQLLLHRPLFYGWAEGKGEGGGKGKFIRWNAAWITSHCPLNTWFLLPGLSRLLYTQGQQATGVPSSGAQRFERCCLMTQTLGHVKNEESR